APNSGRGTRPRPPLLKGERRRLSRAEPAAGPGRVKRMRAGSPRPATAWCDRRHEMGKNRWLAAAGAVALAGVVSVVGVAASASTPGTVMKFDTMAPVTGPYVGAANPIRNVPGGGLPWIFSAAPRSLQLYVHPPL